MEHHFTNRTLGEELGNSGAERTLAVAEECSAHETQYIEITNRAKITAARAELVLLLEEEKDLVSRLRLAEPSHNVRHRRRSLLYYWCVALMLTVAGFTFSLLAFEPFRLGWKAVLYCAGIALLAPFAMERFLAPEKERIVKILAAIAFAAAISGGLLLAVVRGNLLIRAIEGASPAITIEGDIPTPENETPDPFYERTMVLISAVLVLTALGMELSAGLALREARRLASDSGEDRVALAADLREIRGLMIAKLAELTALENEAAAFEAGFWRDFYRALLTRTVRDAMTKLLILVLALTILIPCRAFAADRVNLVVLLDLSKSVDVKGPDGNTPYEQNIQAVTQVLAHVPAGAKVTVIGITSESFAQPDILLSAQIGTDEGFFKEKIEAGRRELARLWQKRSLHLEHDFPRTDILGALLLASQVFQQNGSAGRNVLFIFSDMRQDSSELNFETQLGTVATEISKLLKTRAIADLRDTEVFIAGVDNVGKNLSEWNRLKEFWLSYFEKAGASVRTYTVTRLRIEF